jgi:hypothetical protein
VDFALSLVAVGILKLRVAGGALGLTATDLAALSSI